MKKLLTFVIVAAAIFGCQDILKKDKDKDKEQAKTSSTAGDGKNSGDAAKEDPLDNYSPTVDDSVTIKTQTKSWRSPTDEPNDWDSDVETLQTVIATYGENLPCKARIRYEPSSGDPYEGDFGCPVYECGPKPDETCESEDIPNEKVGDFENADGKKIKCRTITDTLLGGGRTTRTLTYTETSVWTHNDSIRPGKAVKSSTYSCSVSLPKGESGKGVDPCKYVQGRVVTYNRTDEVTVSQSHGKGSNVISSIPTFSYKPAGAVSQPSTASRIRQAEPQCYMASEGSPIQVVLAKDICDDKEGFQAMTLSIGDLKSEGGTDLPVTQSSFTFQYKDKSFANTSACKADLDVDLQSRSLIGNIRCDDRAFTDSAESDKKVSIDRIDFSCTIKEGQPPSGDGDGTGGDGTGGDGTGTGGTGTGGTGTGTATGGTGTGGTGTGGTGTGGTGTGTATGGTGTGGTTVKVPKSCSEYFMAQGYSNAFSTNSQDGTVQIQCTPDYSQTNYGESYSDSGQVIVTKPIYRGGAMACQINAMVAQNTTTAVFDANTSSGLAQIFGTQMSYGSYGNCNIDCSQPTQCRVIFAR